MAQRRILTIGQQCSVGLLGAITVYVAYFPSDSVAVENGDALWLAALSFAWMTLVITVHDKAANDLALTPEGPWFRIRRTWLIDAAMWVLAAWMMLGAFAQSGTADLRMATNEAWWWATAAAIATAGRRVLGNASVRSSYLLLIGVIAVGLSADAIHQDWISLPATKASYRADPDDMLRQLGMDAPENSSTRMIFENRLFDGGPTATFALANSLAAVLVFGVISAAGVLRFGWKHLSRVSRIGWLAGLAVILPAVIAVRSRAALISVLVGLATILVMRNYQRPLTKTVGRSAVALRAWLGLTVVGISAVIGLAMFGNPEWFQQAPASLSFRLQYWRSTWRMVMDNPLFGAGPGNFQSLYDRYREASTTELIADPHNFLFETMASGGPVALGILLVAFAAGMRVFRKRWNATTQSQPTQEPDQSKAVLIGAAVMLALIWLSGLLTLQTPDFESHRYAIPFAIGFGWLVRGSIARENDHNLDQIFTAALIGLLVHLSVSGGWTVPGVAMLAWMSFASLTRIDLNQEPKGSSAFTKSPSTWLPQLGFGLGMLLVLTFMSIRPTAMQNLSIAMADSSQRAGLPGKTARLLDQAVQADTWSKDPALYRCDFLRWQLIQQNNRAKTRQAFSEAESEVIARTGENPTAYRQLANQRMHLYQVFGHSTDLDAAEKLLESAAQWAPANQWLFAQLAEIAHARGETTYAKELTDRARKLSLLGDNIERYFYLQLLYVAEPIGPAAKRVPVRENANKRLDR